MKEIKELKLLQRYLNEMLQDFKSLCDENDLTFFLEGGTLLGATRHHGFIPWDDDIDVSMPRDDYEKLINLLSNNTFTGKYSKYTLGSRKSLNVRHPFPFSKFFRLDTILDEYIIDSQFNSHLFIDVFPIDYLPTSFKETDNIIRKNKIIKKKLAYSIANVNYGSILKKYGKKFLFFPFRLVGYKHYRDLIDQNSSQIKNSNDVGVLVWGYGHRARMKKVDYINYDKLIFEGEKYKVPNNYKYHLEKLYGDYTTLPPKEEQKPKHKYRVWRINE